MSYTLNKQSLNLSETLLDFTEFVASKVFQFGEAFGVAINKAELAKAYGRTPRTITRYLSELEEAKVISTATKTGPKGGVVIMFTTDLVDFEPQENPITHKSMTAKEVRDMLYPAKEKKEPKRKYRSKAEIAEERILKQRKRDLNDELNDLLLTMDYPTKEFWDKTPDPELYYQGYLCSRMYNFYAVYYPTMEMNRAESRGNKWAYEFSKIEAKKFEEYDVLDEQFMGTSDYTCFLKFASMCVNNNIDPAQFLTVQFNFMQYLKDTNATRVNLPFPNTLVTVDAVRRWLGTYEYKKKFRKDHPYFATSSDTVQTVGLNFPIMGELVRAFKEPFSETSEAYQTQIDVTINNRLFVPKMIQAVHLYSETIKQEIKEAKELLPEEKEELSKFITQETANHFVSDQVTSLVTLGSIPQIATMKAKSMGDENLRVYYHNVGNSGLEYQDNPIERATNISRGYRIDFSLFGAKSFLNTMLMVRDFRGLAVDYDVVASAIEKLGERKVPLTPEGFLDTKAIRRKVMTESEITAEQEFNTPVVKNKEEVVDLFGTMWYDTYEEELGQSPRDGRKVFVNVRN